MKKILALAIAVTLLVVLMVTTMFNEEENQCVGTGVPGNSTAAVVNGDFAYPTDPNATTPTSGFGPRWGTMHSGQDLAGPEGTPIYAFADGDVVAAADSGVQGFGGWIVLNHNIEGKQIQTVYGHMNPGGVHVKVGDHVTKGQHIADIGNSGQSTGAHLHFEVVEGDRAAGGQKVDPAPWLEKAKAGKPGGDGGQPAPAPAKESSKPAAPAAPSGGGGRNPNSGKNVPISVAPDAHGLDEFQLNHVRNIIATGKGRSADPNVIKAAVMAAGLESGLRMLASHAVPESLTYPNDGITPGDATSVGLFQIQVPMNMSVSDGMNPDVQIKWFYDTADQLATPSDPAWKIAADTERPREDLRGKYQIWDSAADELLKSEGNIAPKKDDCAPGGGSNAATPANASEFAKKAIEAARRQIGLPYVWGGGDANGPTGGSGGGESGFDCSGLTLYAYAQASGGKINLPHFTGSTSNPGQLGSPDVAPVPLTDIQPGDLVFFGDPANPHHVGLAINSTTMIHAPTFGQTVTEAPIQAMGDLSGARRITDTALK